jgi:3-hydroxybutyryl-CoA dehydratase
MSKMKVGDSATSSLLITEDVIGKFAEASSDYNPIHLDEEHAKKSIFGKRIAHGMLAASVISSIIGNKLPGPGAIYLGQNLKFLAPVFIDDKVTATVEVISIRDDKPIISMRTICANQNGTIVVDGEATVRLP